MAEPWPPFTPQYFPVRPPAPSYFAAPTGFPGYCPVSSRDPKRSLLLTAGVVSTLVVAAVLILRFGAPGFFLTRQLDVHQAQAGIEHVLTDSGGYGAKNVNGVTCNGGHNPTVKKGTTFTCEATIDSVRWQFPVRFTDDAGSYEVGRPQ